MHDIRLDYPTFLILEHTYVDRWIGMYFDRFVVDVIDTYIHAYIHIKWGTYR
jgi:hypothetical protein